MSEKSAGSTKAPRLYATEKKKMYCVTLFNNGRLNEFDRSSHLDPLLGAQRVQTIKNCY